MNNEEQEFKNLTIKHFGFLVNEFEFAYDEAKNQFDTRAIRISIEKHDRTVPSIIIWFKSEPKFTRILLDWLLEEYIDYKEQYHRQLGGRRWFKSGMNHAQTGNLLENLGQ
jgi:hypothetical protein